MTKIVELKTGRLLLRQWKDEDFPVFAKINSDPTVMKYYPEILSEDESNSIANKIRTLIAERSWGFWAVETCHDNKFIGFVGLHQPTYDLPVKNCIEVGWRLGKEY